MINFDNKHILSIDYGSKKLGIATYKVKIDPYPLICDRIMHHDLKQVFNDLTQLINEEMIDVIVLGIPYLTDGTATKKTQEVKDFKSLLMKHLDIQIYEQDETLSTVEAKDRMRNSPRFNFKIDEKLVDSVAACIILEDFMENNRLKGMENKHE